MRHGAHARGQLTRGENLLDHLGGIGDGRSRWGCWYGDRGLVKNLAEQRFFFFPKVG